MKSFVYTLDGLDGLSKTILPYFDGRTVIAFYGEMGVGKTTLIKAICKALNVIDVIDSPTFALVNEYNTLEGKQIFHFDFYRINNIEEAYDFGYEEYFFGGKLCLVEWPEKIEELLPDDCLRIYICEKDNGERIVELAD